MAILFHPKLREVILEALDAEAPVLGFLQRRGKVHVLIVPNACSDKLIAIIREQIRPDGVVHTDAFKSYDGLDV